MGKRTPKEMKCGQRTPSSVHQKSLAHSIGILKKHRAQSPFLKKVPNSAGNPFLPLWLGERTPRGKNQTWGNRDELEQKNPNPLLSFPLLGWWLAGLRAATAASDSPPMPVGSSRQRGAPGVPVLVACWEIPTTALEPSPSSPPPLRSRIDLGPQLRRFPLTSPSRSSLGRSRGVRLNPPSPRPRAPSPPRQPRSAALPGLLTSSHRLRTAALHILGARGGEAPSCSRSRQHRPLPPHLASLSLLCSLRLPGDPAPRRSRHRDHPTHRGRRAACSARSEAEPGRPPSRGLPPEPATRPQPPPRSLQPLLRCPGGGTYLRGKVTRLKRPGGPRYVSPKSKRAGAGRCCARL